jgi:hypothetical protein
MAEAGQAIATRYPQSDRVKGKKPKRGSRVPRESPESDSPPGVRSSEIGVRNTEFGERNSEHFAKQSASKPGTAPARETVEGELARVNAELRNRFSDQFEELEP